MVERVVWDHEAAGSRPVTRTMKPWVFLKNLRFFVFFEVFLDRMDSLGKWTGHMKLNEMAVKGTLEYLKQRFSTLRTG